MLPSRSISQSNNVVGTIIGGFVFAIVGGILVLPFIDLNDIAPPRASRIITCGCLIGTLVGGIVGYCLSRSARIAYYALSTKPIPVNVIMLGQFLGLTEGICIGAFQGNFISLTTGATVGWVLGTFICGFSWIIGITIRRILFVLLLQLIIEIVCGLAIDLTILCIVENRLIIIILDVLLAICCLLSCINMLRK